MQIIKLLFIKLYIQNCKFIYQAKNFSIQMSLCLLCTKWPNHFTQQFIAAIEIMAGDSDSSTESSIQNHKKAARLNRRLKKYKSNRRWQNILWLTD